MAVYGEEYKTFELTSGLWEAESPSLVPPGYCSQFQNVIKSADNRVEIRPSIYDISSFSALNYAAVSRASTSMIPQWDHEDQMTAFEVDYKYPTGTSLAIIATRNAAANATTFTTIPTYPGSTIITQTFNTNANRPISMATYRDRIYGVSGLNTRIIRYLDIGVGAGVTSSTIADVGVLNRILITFRDRLFSANSDGKIYYTEVAAVGGYPENWNSGNNFFEIPDKSATVHNMLVLDDRIWIFTDKGVYQLYALGAVSTWSLQVASQDVRIFLNKGVAIIKDNFVYTDGTAVYLWAGSGTPVEISAPINFGLIYANSITIHPFAKGMIVSAQYFVASGGIWVWTSGTKYYFDGEIWSTIVDEDNAGSTSGNATGVILGIANCEVSDTSSARTPQGSLLIQSTKLTAGTSRPAVGTYKKNRYDVSSIFGGATSDTIKVRITTPPLMGSAEPKLKRVKNGYITGRFEAGTNITLTPIYDGVTSDAATVNPAVTASDYVGVHRFKTNHFLHRLVYTIAASYNGLVAGRLPGFKVEEMGIVINTDNRNSPDGSSNL